MSNRLDRFILILKPDIGLSLKISFGIFLFILFFHPFPINITDTNKLLMTAGGFGFIMFVIIILVRFVSRLLFEEYRKNEQDIIFPVYLNGFAIFLLSSTAFAFYAVFAASAEFTLLITFRILVICLIPPLILGVSDSFRNLRLYNEQLIAERRKIQIKIENYEAENLNKAIEFVSENANENLTLLVSEIIFIRSADNYVEIAYTDGEAIRKSLVRTTLKSIELQIRRYSNFLRCHRTCIVNVHFIEKLLRSSGNSWLMLKGLDEKLPVSRQYLLRIQEAL